MDQTTTRARNMLRNVIAVVAGLATVIVLSTLADIVVHNLYRPAITPADFALATTYRIAFGVAGGYVTAWFSPGNGMKLAAILGLIGTASCAIGVFIALSSPTMGPLWYNIALVVTALPSTLAGAMIYLRNGAPA